MNLNKFLLPLRNFLSFLKRKKSFVFSNSVALQVSVSVVFHRATCVESRFFTVDNLMIIFRGLGFGDQSFQYRFRYWFLNAIPLEAKRVSSRFPLSYASSKCKNIDAPKNYSWMRTNDTRG